MARQRQGCLHGIRIGKVDRACPARAFHLPALCAQGLGKDLRGIAHAEDEQVAGLRFAGLVIGHVSRRASTTPNPIL